MTRKTKILIIIGACLFFIAILALFIGLLTLAPSKNENNKTIFEIKPDTSSIQISQELKQANLIKSKWLFLIYLKLKNGLIQAGTYELSSSYNLSKTIKLLTSGSVKEWIVTFPEGFSLKDMADRLDKKKIVKKEDFLKEASLVSKYEADFPFLTETHSPILEGYLFPDTYKLSIDVNSEEIIRQILTNFNKKIDQNIKFEIAKQNKNLSQVITLASIIEREANKPEDRSKIASVYLNRLALNMKLEADPTVQYAKGSWEPITKEDYKIDSPYNTYKYAGLPPSPICNPGLYSIKAILFPDKTNYFYFFHTKDGKTIFSTTREEHDKKIQEYLK